MRLAILALFVFTTQLHPAELMPPFSPEKKVDMVKMVKQLVEDEYAEGNFGISSFLCEHLEKNNIDDPRMKLIWATSQSRIGNFAKAEKLYLSVVQHNEASNKQKSIACLYLSKQLSNNEDKEKYADMAFKYSKNDLVVDMVSEIYKDLETQALSKLDEKKAEYYRNKHQEFIKKSTTRTGDEAKMGAF